MKVLNRLWQLQPYYVVFHFTTQLSLKAWHDYRVQHIPRWWTILAKFKCNFSSFWYTFSGLNNLNNSFKNYELMYFSKCIVHMKDTSISTYLSLKQLSGTVASISMLMEIKNKRAVEQTYTINFGGMRFTFNWLLEGRLWWVLSL